MTIGIKHDGAKKARPSLIPPKALLAVSEVLAYGAAKYSDDNWKHVRPVSRYRDALLRHVLDDMAGVKTDDESGLPSLAHAICCGLFLLAHQVGDVIEGSPEHEQLDLPLTPAKPELRVLLQHGRYRGNRMMNDTVTVIATLQRDLAEARAEAENLRGQVAEVQAKLDALAPETIEPVEAQTESPDPELVIEPTEPEADPAPAKTTTKRKGAK